MSIPAPGSMMADLLLAMQTGITPMDLNATRVAFDELVELQNNVGNPSIETVAIVNPSAKPEKEQ